jgi:hypothetical protein
MKYFKLITIVIIAVLAAINLTGCLSDNEDVDVTYEAILEVSPEITEGYGFGVGNDGGAGVVEYMKVRKKGNTDWFYLSVGAIESFEYVKGHEYTLKVRVTRLANPPADGPLHTYELIEILSDKPNEND